MKEIEEDIESAKIDITKEKYLDYIRKDTLNGYIMKNKFFKIRAGMFPENEFKRFKKMFKFTDYPIHNFLTTEDITITNDDAIKIIEQNDKPECLIFLDPPYLNSCNCMYKQSKGDIFKYLAYNFNKINAKLYICHENNWIFKLIFRDYITEDNIEYDKKYQMRDKKETKHILIGNQ